MGRRDSRGERGGRAIGNLLPRRRRPIPVACSDRAEKSFCWIADTYSKVWKIPKITLYTVSYLYSPHTTDSRNTVVKDFNLILQCSANDCAFSTSLGVGDSVIWWALWRDSATEIMETRQDLRFREGEGRERSRNWGKIERRWSAVHCRNLKGKAAMFGGPLRESGNGQVHSYIEVGTASNRLISEFN